MEPELIVTAIIGVIIVMLSIMSQVALWQRKEYRRDRMLAFIRSNECYITYGPLLIALAIFLNIGWLAYIANASFIYWVAGWVALLILIAYHGYRIYWRGIYRPRLTLKGRLIISTAIVLVFVYMWLLMRNNDALALQWATVVVFVPALTALAVMFVNFATNWRRRAIIEEAKVLRASLSSLTVVGITGSYGKTSTKHFLDEILTSAKVVHDISTEHRNEELVVAQDMLSKLSASSDIYVVEMGAYRVGEIERSVALTKPDIGIVTAISNQHVGLFGSVKNVIKAKWELVRGLPADGVAILNADDPVIKKKGERIAKKVLWYSTQRKAQVYASDVVIEAKSLSANIHIGKDAKTISIPLIGVVLESVLAATTAAVALGVKNADIFKALKNLKPVARTMELCTGINKSTIIDDSYSGNEIGAILAIQHLDRFSESQKIIVMTPLIELGSEAGDVHCRIGEALAKSSAEVFIFGAAHQKDLVRGASESYLNHLHFITQPQPLIDILNETIKSGAVILLEGRIPDVVRQDLRQ